VLVATGNLFAGATGTNHVLDTMSTLRPIPATGSITITGLYGTLEIDAAGQLHLHLEQCLGSVVHDRRHHS
jgi:hypothetical protein